MDAEDPEFLRTRHELYEALQQSRTESRHLASELQDQRAISRAWRAAAILFACIVVGLLTGMWWQGR